MNEIDTLNQLLNADLSGEQTAMPVLVAGLYKLLIIRAEVKTNQEKGTQYLEFQFSTTAEARTTAGSSLPAGFRGVFARISLTTTEKYNPRQNLARLKEAVFGTHEGPFGQPSDYLNKEVLAQCKPSSDPKYGDSTEIVRFVPAKV